LGPVAVASGDTGAPSGEALVSGGADDEFGGDVHLPASQTRSPLQSVSFVHCALAP